MTGKELILYILQNNLENTVVMQDGMFIGFMTEEEAAVKFNVGVATIRGWQFSLINTRIFKELENQILLTCTCESSTWIQII